MYIFATTYYYNKTQSPVMAGRVKWSIFSMNFNFMAVYRPFGFAKYVSLFFLLSFCATGCSSRITAPESTLLFARGDDGSKFYRIPALAVAADGSLVAAADKRIETMGDLPNKIDIVVRRSEDGGRTWSDQVTVAGHHGDCGYGDPALVVDRTSGDLLCICASGAGLWGSTAENPADIDIFRSSDHGRNWSGPMRITSQLYGGACPDSVACKWYGAFAASGSAVQLQDGTLAFVIAVRTGEARALANYVCISEDGGYRWRVLPAAADMNGDEAKLAELADGTWLMSIRNPAGGRRKYAVSRDRGLTWSQPQCWEDICEPACNGDLIRYTLQNDGFRRNRLLHSIPYDERSRRNVSLLMSYDEGITWPVRKTIWSADAGYSSLAVLPDGTIGMLTEVGGWDEGFDIYFTRITPEWLTDGADAYR